MNTSRITPKEMGVWAPLGQMKLSTYAREHSAADITSRAASMARDGQLQNALVVKVEDPSFPNNWAYELIVGHGRYASAKANGWDAIKVDVYENLTEAQKLSMALSENSEREEASPFYTATLYQAMLNIEGIDQETLANRLSKDRSDIGRHLALNKLGDEVRRPLEASGLGIGHCREFTRLASFKDQMALLAACLKGEWSVRKLQTHVDAKLNGHPAESQESVAAAPRPAFEFKSKKESIVLRVRAFEPTCETFEDYLQELVAAYQQFAAQSKAETSAAPIEERIQTAA